MCVGRRFYYLEVSGEARVKQMHILFVQRGDQAVGLEFRSDEFDQDRNVAGKLKKMLLMQMTVAAVAGNGAERRATLGAALPGELQQPFVQQSTAMAAVRISIKTQMYTFHDALLCDHP